MYSQNNEEEIILGYFGNNSDFGESPNHPGRVLSIGENDGKTLSNALALIELGWSAMLVEPSPEAFTKLCKLHAKREGVYCYEKAVGSKNGKVILHESGTHLGQGDTSLLSTIMESELSRWKNEKFSQVEVDCVTFETLLSLCPIKKFDFITIDCEGVDLEILAQMDLTALGCKCICVEWNGKDEDKFDALITKHGLKQIHKNNENLIYAL